MNFYAFNFQENGNESDSESVKSVNIFEETIVEGKRRHFDTTKGDDTLDKWYEHLLILAVTNFAIRSSERLWGIEINDLINLAMK